MADLYVFFDDNNQIVAVSGNKDAITSARYAIFPEEDVSGFILGTMNMNDFVVRENRKTGKVTLEKKVTHEISTRTIDNTLHKLPNINNQFQIMADLYVYFDDSNQIVAVSGNKDATASTRYAIFPGEDVSGFILGTMNMNDFVVRENRKTGKVTLEKKITHEISVRTIDNTLYKLPKSNDQFQIKVLNSIEKNCLVFILDADLRGTLIASGDSITINGVNELNFFFTKVDDPHFFKKHINFSVEEFISSDIEIEYTENLKNVSVFTKRIYDDYIYEEI